MPSFRVVSIDGGPAYLTAGMLQELQRLLEQDKAHKDFLNHANVFAGTSAGSWLALFLAQYEHPSDALGHALEFWYGAMEAIRAKGVQGAVRFLAAVGGRSAVLSPNPIRDYFKEVFGRNTRLGDLKQKVVIPAFQLDNLSEKDRSWKDKIFHNFDPKDPDCEQLVVDVALRSAAAPIELPAWQSITGEGPSYVDGGFFAPVTSLVAIAQVLKEYPESQQTLQLREEISMLSCGAKPPLQFVDPWVSDGYANWGWYDWLLDPEYPGLLVSIALSSGAGAAEFITRQLLGANRCCRISPILRHAIPPTPLSGDAMLELVDAVLSETETKRALQDAAQWLVSARSGWFERPEPRKQARPRKRRAVKKSA